MKKENNSVVDDSYKAKKINIDDNRSKERFADFYSNILKVESQRRQSIDRVKKNLTKVV